MIQNLIRKVEFKILCLIFYVLNTIDSFTTEEITKKSIYFILTIISLTIFQLILRDSLTWLIFS